MISTEDKLNIFNGMKDKFIADIEKMQSERDEMEVDITNKARNTLKEAEHQLVENCPQHGFSKSILCLAHFFILPVISSCR